MPSLLTFTSQNLCDADVHMKIHALIQRFPFLFTLGTNSGGFYKVIVKTHTFLSLLAHWL